jgi:hypothetical protein
MRQTFHLSHEQARQRAIQAVQSAPDGFVVQVKESSRTLEQNALIHALLTDVGQALNWKFNGQTVDVEDLKSIFVAAYRKTSGEATRFVVGLDGQPVILNWRTRDFTKRECAEFVEMVYAWLTEQRQVA